MRTVIASIVLAAPLALIPAAAQAQSGPNAHATIQRGDYAAAEQKLAAEARIFPNRPEVLLNLAAVYAKTGRISEARTLYNRVLDLQPVVMDVVDGKVSPSHVLATRGINQLETVEIAAR